MDGILRAAVAATNAAFMGAAVDVTIQQWVGHKNGYAEPDYGVAFTRKAMVREGATPHRSPTDETITPRATIEFVEAIPANGAAGRHEPLDPRDRVTLPSGLSGPVVEAPGSTVDPATGRPFINVYWLK